MSQPRLFSSLRFRLILLVFCALLPTIGILLYNAAESRQREVDKARDDVFTLSQLAARQQEQVIDSAHDVLVSLAELPEVRGNDPAACSAKLIELLQQYEGYTGFAVAQVNGDLFCRSAPLTEPVNVAESASFRQALITGDLGVGEYQVGRATGKPTLGLCYPSLGPENQTQAVLCGGLDLNRLNQLAAEVELPEGSTLLITDRKGTILVRYPATYSWIGQSLPGQPLIQTVLEQTDGQAELKGLDGVTRLYGFTSVHGDSIHIAVGVPIELAFAGVYQRLARDLALLGIAMLLAMALTWWGSAAFVLQQVKALVRAAERLSHGDLGARSGLPADKGEIGQLSQAFDSMAAALEQREAARRQAEQALYAQREWLRITLASIGDAVIATDIQGNVTFMNPVAEALTGWGQAAAVGQPLPTVFKIVNAQTRATAEDPVAKVLRAGAIVGLANHTDLIAREGKELPIDDSGAPIKDEAGNILGVVLIFRDITERAHNELSQRLLAEAGRLLTAPLDSTTRLTNVAQLAVPLLADWCAVDVAGEDGSIQRVAVTHVDPAKVALAHELLQRYPPATEAPHGIPHVLRTGEAEFYPLITEAMLEADARDAGYLRIVKELQVKSAIIAPLIARGRVLGALTLVWAESGRSYSRADLALAEELARRAALALDNARLYDETQRLNADLERRITERTAQLYNSNTQLQNEIAERRQAQRQLEDFQAQLRQLSAHLQAAREEERARIAREIHDELGQVLTGLKMDLAWLQRSLKDQDSEIGRKLSGMLQMVDTTIKLVRQIATELRPGVLDDLGLVPAIEWQLSEFQSRTNIQCKLNTRLDELALDADGRTALFRIFQETLTNVARHANATVVEVNIEENPHYAILQVQDNGRGITESDVIKARSFGLLGMRERVHLLNGDFSIRGVPGQGTTVVVRLPRQAEAERA